jgi:hypothetical protein
LIVIFTALYVLFSFIPLFQLTGLGGRLITATSILAPIIGILVGPAIGGSSALLGGLIALSISPGFSPPSLIAGIVAALFGGLLTEGKRIQCALLYSAFLLVFTFYPTIGPAWLFPQMIWFQVFGLALLASPLQKIATENFRSKKNVNLFFAFLVTVLSSTLASQVAGSIAYEAVYWPVLIPSLQAWVVNWQVLTFLYPVERTIIALIAALIGTPLLRVVRSAKLSIHVNKIKKANSTV